MGLLGRHSCVFCVGGGSHPDDAIAQLEVVHFARGAQGDDFALSFAAKDLRFGGGVEPGSEIAAWFFVRMLSGKGREGRKE